MNDHKISPPPTTTQISIQEIIQIRVLLGNENQVDSAELSLAIAKLDTIILNFANDLNFHKGK